MSEYDEFKSVFITHLHSFDSFDTDMLKRISDCLDDAFCNYSIRRQQDVTDAKFCNSDILKQYLTAKEVEGCSDGTIRNYRYILTLFLTFVEKKLDEIEITDVRRFLREYKNSRSISDQSLDKYREAICWFFKWCHEEGVIPANPVHNLKPIRHEEKERKALSRLELELLRSACKDIRERAIIEFLYSTACRVSELCNVKKTDVDFHEQSVKIFGKGKKERTSWINAKCLVTLNLYLESRNDDSEYLFVNRNKPHGKCQRTSIEKLITNIQNRVSGISFKVTPHIMRHSSATHALQSGMDIQEIQKFLGHSKVDTTMKYAHVSTDDVRLSHRKHVI